LPIAAAATRFRRHAADTPLFSPLIFYAIAFLSFHFLTLIAIFTLFRRYAIDAFRYAFIFVFADSFLCACARLRARCARAERDRRDCFRHYIFILILPPLFRQR